MDSRTDSAHGYNVSVRGSIEPDKSVFIHVPVDERIFSENFNWFEEKLRYVDFKLVLCWRK